MTSGDRERAGWRHPVLTCDPNLVELSEFLIVAFSRNIVPQADGAQGNKTKIKGFQKVPVVLQDGEHSRRDEKEAGHGDEPQEHGVDDGHQLLREAPADVEVEDRPTGDVDGDALDHSCQEQEGERDADDRVDDAEGLAAVRQGHSVAIACEEAGRRGRKHARKHLYLPPSPAPRDPRGPDSRSETSVAQPDCHRSKSHCRRHTFGKPPLRVKSHRHIPAWF